MIDKEYRMFSNFEKLLATCQRDPTKEEYYLCIDSFPYLNTKILDDGHLDDSIFDEVGFRMDTNASGQSVRRDVSITQESQQQAEWLTRQSQINLCRSRLESIERDRHQRKMEELKDVQC